MATLRKCRRFGISLTKADICTTSVEASVAEYSFEVLLLRSIFQFTYSSTSLLLACPVKVPLLRRFLRKVRLTLTTLMIPLYITFVALLRLRYYLSNQQKPGRIW